MTTDRQRVDTILRKIDWAAFMPISGITPADVFFSTHANCRSGFFGRHWLTPGFDLALLPARPGGSGRCGLK